MSGGLLATALGLDLLLGEPPRLPHPVVGVGRLIMRLERSLCRHWGRTRGAGVLLVLLTLAGAVGAAALVWWAAQALHPVLGGLIGLYMAYSTLALRGLHRESRKVVEALAAGNLPEARRALSLIVGRDTQSLDEAGILRACVETVAENSSDGVIAPLFYLWLGGPLLAVAYKTINTLDSMVGYRNDRYRQLGWAAARLDDLANGVPARLTALAMVATAPLVGLSGRHAWRVLWRDRAAHPSPNAGWPEAAAAGALGVQLGGPSFYQGTVSSKPTLGDAAEAITHRHYRGMIRLLYGTVGVVIVLLLLLEVQVA